MKWAMTYIKQFFNSRRVHKKLEHLKVQQEKYMEGYEEAFLQQQMWIRATS